MLVLSRLDGERIRIGNDVVITLVRTNNGKARIGIEAPPEIPVDREEIYQSKLRNPLDRMNPRPPVPAK